MNNASNGGQNGEILEHLASVTDNLQNVYDAHLVDDAHTLVTQLILIVVEGERCEHFRVLSDTENHM